MGVLTKLLGAVAAASLLVAGIGIMSNMRVSVTEKTHEIGLRLAAGTLERKMLLQFLIESVVLSAPAGLSGVADDTDASNVLAGVTGVPWEFDPTINLLSLLFSAGTGIAAGPDRTGPLRDRLARGPARP
mgnify:CR=1 FL=1